MRSAFLAACLVICGCTIAQAQNQPKLEIGVIIPLSGDYAAIGRFIRNAAELAVKQRPQSRQEVRLIFEDDQLDPKRSVAAYQRLVNSRKVRTVIGFGSAVGHALAPLAEKDGTLFVAVGASDPMVSRGRRYTFSHWVAPEAEARVTALEALRRGYRRIAVLGQEQDGVLAFMRSFRSIMQESQAEDRIVLESTFSMDTRDFKVFIIKAKAAGVDAVCVTVFAGALSAFAKQARALGLKADIFGAESFEDWTEVQAADGALNGAWYSSPDSAGETFQRAYRIAFDEPAGFGAANAYDAVNLLIDAAENGASTPGEIAAKLSNLKDYSGAAGLYSATGDNRFTLPAAIKQVGAEGFEKIR